MGLESKNYLVFSCILTTSLIFGSCSPVAKSTSKTQRFYDFYYPCVMASTASGSIVCQTKCKRVGINSFHSKKHFVALQSFNFFLLLHHLNEFFEWNFFRPYLEKTFRGKKTGIAFCRIRLLGKFVQKINYKIDFRWNILLWWFIILLHKPDFKGKLTLKASVQPSLATPLSLEKVIDVLPVLIVVKVWEAEIVDKVTNTFWRGLQVWITSNRHLST